MPKRPWTPYAVLCGTELRFGIEIPLIYATAECQNLRIRLVPNSWDSPVFCGTELWVPKPVIPTNAFAAFATLVCQRNCVFLCKGTKLKNSAKPNSGDSLPVFALECFSANETGVLGLWLGAFGKSGLLMCQSTPGPPMPCFVAQSFAFVAQSFGGQSQSSRPTLLPSLQL